MIWLAMAGIGLGILTLLSWMSERRALRQQFAFLKYLYDTDPSTRG
jgi:hypothetical protein